MVNPYLVQLSERSITADGQHWLHGSVLVDGKVAGSCLVTGMKLECPMISYLHIDKSQRRKGVGTAIINGCIARLRRAGKTAVTLVVNKKNKPAHRLYSKLGFQVYADDPKMRWMSFPLKTPG